MSIDWVTVAAQIINFLALVWLLKRFLYRPILDGIDARETEIARRMAEAGEAESRAALAEAEFREQTIRLASERKTAIDTALDTSKAARDALLADAREKLDRERQSWHSQLDEERLEFLTRLEQAGAETLVGLTRKALHDLADEHLETAIARQVIKRLRPLLAELREAAGQDRKALASTREPLPSDVRAQLTTELIQLLPDLDLRFETNSDQAHGLILRIGGAQIDWTIDSYTDEFGMLLNENMASELSGRSLKSLDASLEASTS